MGRVEVEADALVAILEGWCPRLPGCRLYYLTLRQQRLVKIVAATACARCGRGFRETWEWAKLVRE